MKLARNSISVVVPAFNEEKTVEDVVKVAIFVLKRLQIDYEIVLVNDGSTDQTGVIINRLAKGNKCIQVIHHPQNRGFSGAMKTCFKNAKKEYIFLGPADGQFNFKELPKFLDAIKEHDVVMGYRIKFDESFMKKLKIILFHFPFLFLCRILLGIKIREFSVSLWRKKVYQSIKVESEGRSAMFLPELVSKALKRKYKFTEIPIKLYKRKGGKAKGTSLEVALRTFFAMIKFRLKFS